MTASSLGSVHSTCRLVLLSSWHGLSRGVLWRLIYHLLSCSPPYVLSCSMLAALFSCAVFVRSSFLRKKKLVESLVDWGSCITFARATQKSGSSEVSGGSWVVSKFWRLESCLSASLSRSQTLTSRTLYKCLCDLDASIYNRCPRRCDPSTSNKYQTKGTRLSKKKLLRKFGGFKKLLYLCIRNSKERVVGSVRCTVGGWWRRQLIEALAELI